MKLSLAKKQVFGGILLVLVPILVLGWFSYEESYTGLTDLAKDNAFNTAQRVADLAGMVMQEEVKLAESLAGSPTMVRAAQKAAEGGIDAAKAEIKEMEASLVAFQQQVGTDYESVVVIGLDGIVFGDSMAGKNHGMNLTQRVYFQSAKSGKVDASDVVMSKISGKPVSAIAVPIKGSKGQTVGVLASILDISFLIKAVSGFKLGQTGYAWMVNADGLAVAHPDPARILKLDVKKTAGMEEAASKMLSGQSGVTGYTYQGIDKTCGFAPVPLTGWSVAFTQNDEEFLESVYNIRDGVALIGSIALVISIILVVFFSRRITKPISMVAEGINEASSQVASAATQVSASSQQLAEGSSEQAASLEETSSSLEELSSMTKQNAENAQQANTLSGEAGKVVSEAAGMMNELTKSMQDISSASEQTAGIIKTIDEIAFQTNLLALNAAVEAARAGEVGAGFAVVADEVRSLAIRAAEAAQNTAQLIEGTVEKVHVGSQLVEKTDQAFRHVADSTEKVLELVGEIAAASDEQAQGIDQINQAMNDMDKVTQGLAANAEETASASEEMNGQADSLHAFVADLVKVISGQANGSERAERRPRPGNKKSAKPLELKPPHMKSNPSKAIPMDDDDFADF